MPKAKDEPATPAGFQPIEVEVGAQNPPAVSEVDFSSAAQAPEPHPAATTKPQPAATHEED